MRAREARRARVCRSRHLSTSGPEGPARADRRSSVRVFADRGRAAGDGVTESAQTDIQEQDMKKDIHPDYQIATVKCVCGNEFKTRSTLKEISVEICAACHPFFTGQQKLVDSAGRVERFMKKYGKDVKGSSRASAKAKAKPAADTIESEEKPAEKVKAEEKPVKKVKAEEKPVEEVKAEEKPADKSAGEAEAGETPEGSGAAEEKPAE